jgi:hypothetical protein
MVDSMTLLSASPDSTKTIGAAVLLGWGLLDCFWGYRIFRLAVALIGALVLGLVASGWIAPGASPVWFWCAFGLGAVVGLVVSFAFYLVGVFLAGFALGCTVVLGLVPFLGPAASMLVGAIAGVVTGLLALVLQRLLISAATAFSGALRIVLAGAFFLENLDWQFYLRTPAQIPALLTSHWWLSLVLLGLGLFGLMVQLGNSSGKTKDKASK